MNIEKIDYASIIADLEAKRTALDNAIGCLRALAASGALGSSDGVIATTAMPFAASGSGEVPDGVFHGKTVPAAIKLYLSLMHKKQTAREISDGLKKGGLESTSKWFDKIIYATLDRLRKAGEVVKIENQWGLCEWYPALVKAGLDNSARSGKIAQSPSAKRGKSVSTRTGQKPGPGPGDMIDWFLRDNPGYHTAEEVQSSTGVKNLKVTMMLLGQLVKKGKVEKTADGRYRKVS